MTLVDTETGEITEPITESDVRASIRRVIDHAESIWNEWAWQVENHTWEVLGYESWDEMRRVEYSSLTSVSAPRAERPELVARFRSRGPDGKPHLTQRETADTLGIGQASVSRHDPTDNAGTGRPRDIQMDNSDPDDDIIDGEIVEDDEPEGRKRTNSGTPEPESESQDLALINDLRGPWSKGITQAARKMTPKARNHVIAALEAVLEEMRNMK